MKRHSGFTLVEIAIVLVIVGLLLGGALKGQELIGNAKAKNLANDFRNIPLFIYGYQDKFRSLPGDDALAGQHISNATAATCAGCLGNSAINGGYNSTTQTDESYLFWQHVRLAGLASGSTTASDAAYVPRNAEGGLIGVQSANNPPVTGLRGTHVACSDGIPGKFARQIDIAMDDGDTATGSMRAALTSDIPSPFVPGTSSAATAVAAANIVDASTYTVCYAF